MTDGPFAETKEGLGGFYIVEARDLDHALELGKACPGLWYGIDRGPARVGLRPCRLTRRPRARPSPPDHGSLTPLATADGTSREAVDRLFREHHGRAVATLIGLLGDFDLAEESLQDAYLVALEKWPVTGLPRNPEAWIVVTARNRAIDRLRRAKRLTDKQAIARARGRIEAADAADAEAIVDGRDEEPMTHPR